MKLSVTTTHKALIITASGAIAGIVVAAMVHGEAGVFAGISITVIGVIASFWLEIAAFNRAIEKTDTQSQETGGHVVKVGVQLQEAIKQLGDKMEERTLPINPRITNDKPLYDAVTNLVATTDGMAFLIRSWILADAAEHLKRGCYSKLFEEKYLEESRVALLTDVINHASKYVHAFSYADKEHIMDFWNEHKNSALPEYKRAHESALTGRAKHSGFRLRRVFVMPDNLPEAEAEACGIFCDLLQELLTIRGMTDLYLITESRAKQGFPKGVLPTRSFFIADDCFISEGKSERTSKLPYARITADNDKEVVRLRNQFKTLMQCVTGPVNLTDIQKLRERLDSNSPDSRDSGDGI